MAVTVQNVGGVLTYYSDGTPITAAEARTLLAATPTGTAAINEKALLDKVQAGDKVRVRVVSESGRYVVTEIQPAR